MTWAEKIKAILATGRLGRQAEREILHNFVLQIERGADETSIPWNWKALIDRRYDETVVQGRQTA